MSKLKDAARQYQDARAALQSFRTQYQYLGAEVDRLSEQRRLVQEQMSEAGAYVSRCSQNLLDTAYETEMNGDDL